MPAPAASIEDSPVRMSVEHLDLYYGDHHALKDVSIDLRDRQVTSFIGPSGCGKSTLLRCLNRMNDMVKDCRIEGKITLDGEDILPKLQRHASAPDGRHGLPAPQSLPHEYLRQRGVWSARSWHQNHAELEEIVEESLTRAALWDEVKDKLKQSGLGLSGGPAAAPVHRPCHRGQAQDLAYGRAHECTRPHLDRAGGAARHGAQEGVHARRGHAQHAAGIAHFRLGRVFPAGRTREHAPTAELFSAPKDSRTSDYLTGRFG